MTKVREGNKTMDGNLAMATSQVHMTEKEMAELGDNYPQGTTKEQWDRYYKDLKAHLERVERERPVKPPLCFTHYKPTPNYPTHAETALEAGRIYGMAMSEWEMMRSCDAPNKPGYHRANND